jgi:hypothetical protein
VSATRLYFGEWLDAYDGTDPAIADLRDDFRRSYRFKQLGPLDFKTPEAVRGDLLCWQARPDAHTDAALEAAGAIYAQQPNAYPTEQEVQA